MRLLCTCAALVLALLLTSCSKDEPGVPGPTKGTKKAKVDPAAEQRKKEERAELRKQEIAQLKATRDTQGARVADLKREYEALKSKHEAERKALPDLRKLQQRLMSVHRDAMQANSRYEVIKKRIEKVRAVAEKAVTGEIKSLRKKLKNKDAEYREVLTGWRANLSDKSVSRVEQSPVKRKLDALRALKAQWMKLTIKTRAGGAGAGAKSEVSSMFRALLTDDTKGAVIKDVLARPEANRKSVASYDFTQLDFYLLMKLHEDALDRQNIAVEKRELGENEGKLRELEKEVDALREEIGNRMAAGGDDLERYEDLRQSLGPARERAESLNQQLTTYSESLKQIESVTERQDGINEKAVADLNAAEKALKKTKQKLRGLGVR